MSGAGSTGKRIDEEQSEINKIEDKAKAHVKIETLQRPVEKIEERDSHDDGKSEDEDINQIERQSSRKTSRMVFTIKLVKFVLVITLVLLFFLAELVVGIATNTMALVADSLHMLTDSLSFGIGVVALIISVCNFRSNTYTYGCARAEVLGGLVNSVFFLAIVIFILLESTHRFIHPEPMEKPLVVLIVGCVGVCLDIVGLCLFGHHHHSHDHHHIEKKKWSSKELSKMTKVQREEVEKFFEKKRIQIKRNYEYDIEAIEKDHLPIDEKTKTKILKKLKRDYDNDMSKADKPKKVRRPWNLNMMGVFFHVLGDVFGGLCVIFLSAINLIFVPEYDEEGEAHEEECMKNCSIPYFDPIVSCFLAFIIFFATIPVLFSSAKILMHKVPQHVDLKKLKTAIRRLKGVIDLHDVHVWTVSEDTYVSSMHLCVADNINNFNELTKEIHKILHDDFNIHASTIQPEFTSNHQKRKMKCLQRCVDSKCISKNCCPQDYYDEVEFFAGPQVLDDCSDVEKTKKKKKTITVVGEIESGEENGKENKRTEIKTMKKEVEEIRNVENDEHYTTEEGEGEVTIHISDGSSDGCSLM